MNWPESRFWDYSLDVYARPPVGLACLRLQDEAGADVNILLLCLWLASLGKPPLSPQILGQIDREAGPWRDTVIRPLRQARLSLAAFPSLAEMPVLKSQIQRAEFDAEHSAQLRLEILAIALAGSEAADRPPAEIAAMSLGNYLTIIAPGQAESFAESLAILARNAA